jgi:hypothetical protein
MNSPLTSPDIVVSPPLQRAQYQIALNSPGSAFAGGDRGGISGDLTDFSSTNGALHAVKVKGECDESHSDLTRHRGKFSVATSTVLHRITLTWTRPRRWRSKWHFR